MLHNPAMPKKKPSPTPTTDQKVTVVPAVVKVTISGQVFQLTVEKATELRDALTAALPKPVTLAKDALLNYQKAFKELAAQSFPPPRSEPRPVPPRRPGMYEVWCSRPSSAPDLNTIGNFCAV